MGNYYPKFTKRLCKSILYVIFIGFISHISLSQTTYYSTASGNFNTALFWSITPTGLGIHTYINGTTNTNTYVVQNGHTITITGTTNIGEITVNSGGTFLISNTGTVVAVSGNITVNGTFTHSATGATSNLTIGGNLVNNSIFSQTAGLSKIIFNNTTANQSISGNGTTQLRTLSLQKASGFNLNLGQNIRVDINLELLNAGNLALNTYDLTLGSGASITGGAFSSTRMIQQDGTSNTGAVIKEITSPLGAAFIYPIGTGIVYTPAEIGPLTATIAGTGSISVKAIPYTPPGGSNNIVTKYWSVSATNITSITDAQVKFYYAASEVIGTPNLVNRTESNINYTATNSFADNTLRFFGAGTGNTFLQQEWRYINAASVPITYYSYQSGNWTTAATWTTDPTGTVLQGSPASGPTSIDNVVVLNGRTVTMNASTKTVSSVTINSGGILDIAATTGHNLGTIQGTGTMKLSTATLPSGNFDPFVASTGGTIEYNNAASFTLPSSQVIYNNLTINLTTAALIATELQDLTLNGNLRVQRGVFRINDNASTTTLDLTISQGVTVDANGSISVGTADTRGPFTQLTDYYIKYHRVYIQGDLVNNGNIKFTNLANPTYNADATTGAASVWFQGLSNNTLTLNGTTDFQNLIVDKGTDQQFILTVNPSSEGYFRLYGRNDLNGYNAIDPTTNPNPFIRKSLYIKNGTIRFIGYTHIPTLSEGTTGGTAPNSDFYIPGNGALWIDGDNVKIYGTANTNAQTTVGGVTGTGTHDGISGAVQSTVVYGLFKISRGNFETRFNGGLLFRPDADGQISVEGGILKATQIRSSSVSATGGRGSYFQSGGEVVVVGDNYGFGQVPLNGAQAVFSINRPTSVFQMSGGKITIEDAFNNAGTNGSAFHIGCAPGNYSVTGGTIELKVQSTASVDYEINSTAPIYNLIVNRLSGTYNATLETNNLTVLNDFTINTGSVFTSANLNVTVNGNFSNTGTYTPGTNTTTFSSTTQNQALTLNTGSTTNFNNLIISNTFTNGQINIGGTLPSKTFDVNGYLTLSSGTFNDGGFAVNVRGNITNTSTHAGTGKIRLNNSVAGAIIIDGDGNGQFGNLELDDTNGFSYNAKQKINGTLTLTNGVLSIQSLNLEFGSAGAISVTSPSGTKMIQTSGLQSDGGITKQFTSPGTFSFPFGSTINYTPATYQLISASSYGAFTIRPVNIRNPFDLSTNNALDYYWKVNTTSLAGTNSIYTFNYLQAAVKGTETNYRPGFIDIGSSTTWTTESTTDINTTSNTITFNGSGAGTASLDGDYTAGESTAFGTVTAYYSRTTGNWETPATWSTDPVLQHTGAASATVPTSTSPVFIGSNHTVTVTTNTRQSGALEIDVNATLDLGTTTGHNFGTLIGEEVTGNGTLRISSSVATAQFPAGDFGDFIGPTGGTVEYYRGTTNFTIPTASPAPSNLNLSSYYNLVLTAAAGTITFPDKNLTIYNNLTSKSGTSLISNTTNGNLDVKNDILVQGGTLRFQNTTLRTVNVEGDIIISSGTFDVANTGTAVDNSITIKGNITNNGTLDFNQATTRTIVNFTGNSNATISGTGATTDFYQITLNKGNSQTYILEATSSNFSISGASNAAIKPLTLTNGIFKLNTTAANLTLSSGTGDFYIPSSTQLWVNQGTVNVTGSAIGIFLSGKLKITNTGIVNISSVGNENYILVAGAGSPSLEIGNSASLTVGSQIRRSTGAPTGSLVYSQSGSSTVTIGAQTVPQDTRGVFEILNTGSNFTMSGGTLTIVRPQTTPSIAAFYLDPETYSVTGGVIKIGNASTPNSSSFKFNSSIALWDVEVDNSAAVVTKPTLVLDVNTLQVKNDLTVDAGTNLTAQNLNVSIGRHFILNGTYTPGTNTTIFDGTSGTQNFTNASAPTLYNLNINTGGTVILNTSNITVSNNLLLTTGTLNDNGRNISVKGNITNNALHTSTGSGRITLNGASQQFIYGNGNGQFGGVEIDNALGVATQATQTINGTLTFTNGVLDISNLSLVFGQSALIAGTPSATKMIRTTGALSNAGVKKNIGTGAFDFTFPIGVLSKYTPARFYTATNSSSGSITVVPVNTQHPLTTDPSNKELNYYWSVSGTGLSGTSLTQVYNYIDADAIGRGTESSYVGARLNRSTSIWGFPYTVNSAANTITYTNVLFIDGDYTAGETSEFSAVSSYQTASNGDWNTTSTWVGGIVPPSNAPVIINANHQVIISTNNKSTFSLTLQSGSKLTVGTTVGHSFGNVSGTGTISAQSSTFPAGNYAAFVASGGGTIEFTGTAYTATTALNTYNNLIINSSGSITLAQLSDLYFNGNVTIQSGTLVGNDQNLYFYGNFINNGSFTPSNTNSTFSGTNAQSIGGTSSTTFYDLVLNKSSNSVTLNAPVTVSNQMTFSSGLINTTSTNLLTISATGSVSSASDLSFVSGPISKIGGGSAFIFPTGKNCIYRPITLSSFSTSRFTAEYFNSAYNSTTVTTPITGASDYEYWDLSRVSGAETPTATLVWSQGNIIPVTDLTSLKVTQWNGSSWINASTSAASGTIDIGSISSNVLSTFGRLTFGTTSDLDHICPGTSNVVYTALNAGSGTTYTWTTDSPALVTITPNGGDPKILDADFGTTSGSGNIILTVTKSGCTISIKKYPFVVEPSYSISAAGGITTVCNGSSAALSLAAGAISYQWYKDGGIISGATSNTYSATATGSYSAIVTTSYCTHNVSSISITIDPTSVGGSVSGGTIVCSGSASGILTLTGYTGTIVKWQSSLDGTTWTDIANTTNTYTSGVLTATTQFRGVVKSGTCASANSAATTVTVSTGSIGGAVSGGTTICSGASSGTLTLSGYTGSIVKWQSSLDGTTWTDIINTAATYASGPLAVTIQFRAVVQNGSCPSANSTAVTVTVDPATVAGSVSGGTTVCSGATSGVLTLGGGYVGSIVKWQSSLDGTTWTDIVNTTATYTSGALTATTQFRAVVKSGSCAAANSATTTVTVDPATMAGTVSGGTTVCSGATSSILTLAGYTGSIVKWQSSLDGTTWSDIVNTAATYTSGALTATTQFRAVVKSGACAAANSTATTVTVDPATVAGAVSGGTTVCSGSTSGTLTLGGGYVGSIIKWQSSLDGTTWSDIANTAATYTSGALAATTQFRAVVKSGSCAAANSGATTVTLNPTTVAGAVSGGTTVCSGATSGTLTLAGYTGSIQKWQSSLDGTTWTDIVNTAATYTSGALTATTQFRAVVKSGTCAAANSTATTVTVDPATVAGAVSGGATICSGATSGTLTLGGGYVGSIVKWQSSLDGTTWTDIVNTTNTYTSAALSATTQFRAVVKSGSCAAANSTATTVTVDPATVAGTVSGGTTVCSGSASGTLILAGHTGSILKWQSSLDGTTWTDIVNTTSTYTSGVLTATTQFRAVVKSGTCAAVNSTATTVTVDPATVAGAVSGGTTVCSGSASGVLTLAGYIGSIVKWQSSLDGTTWTDIVNTAATYTSGALTATTQFRAVVKSGSCAAANSTATTVTVDQATVAGAVSGGTTVCSGATSGTLTLAGHTGSIVKWQSSLDGTTWTDIVNTAATYTSGALTTTTQFRAVVKSGTCAAANSTATTVTVDPATVAGAVSGGITICSGSASGTLTLAGHTGSIVKWQSSLDGTTWTDIVNTAATYTSGALTATTQFRAVVKSGACAAANSTATTVTVDPATVAGAVSGGTTICSGAISGTLTLGGGYVGSIVKWQSSLDGTTWTDIANTTATYTSGALSATTQFRAVVKSGACAAANSTATTVTVDPATVAGAISGGATVCSGATSGTLTLAGHTGSIQKWQSSLDGTTWTDIVNTAATYTSGVLTATTQFRAVVKSGTCAAVNSTATTVTVDPATVAGAVSGGTTVCSGSTSGILTLAGHTGSIVKWQSSLDGTTWNDIVNTAATYTSGALTATTQFRAVVKSGTCAAANSTATTVTVDPATVAGAVSGGTTVCTSSTSGTLTLAGHTGSIVKWQSSLDGTTWSDIANTAATYTSGALTTTTQFRAVVKSGSCVAANSSASTVIVDPATIAGAVSGGTTVCTGSTSGTLTLAGHTGSIVKWQSSLDGTTWTDIVNTAATYTSGALTATTQFRAVVKSGSCAATNSTATTVTVDPATVAGSVSGGTTVCSGATSWTLTLAGYTGSIQKWQSSLDGTTWTDIANTTATYTSGALTATTQFRAIVKSGTCAAVNSTATTVTVDPATVAGSVSGGTTVCSGAISGTLTLAGYTGSIVKWQSSLDGTTWNDIVNTAATYTSGALTATTQFRAVVKSGACVAANSTATTVTVNPATVAGSVSGGTTVCTGSASGTLTLVGHTGSIVKWQSSLDGTTWSDITNTAATYTSGVLTATTQFRAVVKSGACAAANSTATTVTVDPATVAGAVSGGTTICSGATSGTLTLGGGYVGSIVKWQSSLDGTTWTDIVNTAAIYTSSALSATTQFRAVVKSGSCAAANSTATTVTVNPATVAGAVSGGTTVCSGSASSTLTLAGHTGSIIKWQSSPDGTTWTDIVNTAATYTSGALTTTMQFRAVMKSGTCAAANSTATTVTVDPATVAGAVSGGTTVCSGSASGVLTLAGYTGSIVKWQSSLDGTTWNDIVNTAATYTSGALTATTQFRAVVKSGSCAAVNSASTTVTVDPATVAGSVSGGTTVCTGSASGTLTLAGHTGSIVKWQSSPDGTTWTDIANTTSTYTSGVLTTSTQFRAVVKSGSCVAANSAATTVTVDPATVAGAVSGGTIICSGATSGTLTLAGYTGSIQKWQSSLDGTTWTDIANTTATYTSGVLTATTRFRAVVQNGTCVTTNSASTTVTVNPAPIVSITNPTAICSPATIDLTSSAVTMGSTVGLIYTYWTNAAATAALTSPTAVSVSGTYYIKGTTVAGCSDLQAVTVTINPASNISVTNPAAVCSPVTVDLMSPAVTAGSSPGLTYSYWTNAAATSALASPAAVSVSGTYYIKGTTIAGCLDIQPVTVTINPATVAGSVSGGTSICEGSNSALLTLTGYTGSILKWQSSTNGTTWNDIANNGATYTSNVLSQTTQFRAVVENGGCNTLNSSATTVTVNPTTVAGSVSGGTTVCAGSTSATLNLTGNTGAILRWQSSPDGTTWTDIANTAATYISGALAQTTQFRAVVQGGACSEANSTSTTVTVDPATVAGSVSGGTTICSGSIPGTLTLVGYTGSIQKWQYSVDGSTWIDISNITATYTSGALTAATLFRAVVKSGSCTLANSGATTVTVDPTTVAGSVSGGTTICNGSSSGTLTLSGHTGSVAKWQSSPDGTTWTDIANTANTYTSGALTSTIQFRAVVKSGACTAANSTSTTVLVDPITIGGSVSGGTTVCSGSTSGTLTLTGYIGSIQKWQYSVDGITWTDIVNNAPTYTSGTLTTTTQFRAVVKSGSCLAANSTSTTVTIDAATIAGSVSGGTTICSGSTSSILTLAGYTGSIQKWQYSLDGTIWSDIANTDASYTSDALTATTRFRAVVQNGTCVAANSASTTVTVDPATIAGSVSGGTTVCTGSTSETLTLAGHTGSIIKWQSSPNGTTWTDIANTTATYTSGALSATTQFRAVVKSGACAAANSTATTVTVDPATVAGAVSGGATVCSGVTSGTLTLAGYTGSIQKWQSSLDGTTWTDIANTVATYTSGALTATTQFRAVVKSGTCAAANSTATTVTVDPATIAGSVSDGTTVCSGATSGTLTLGGGYVGSIIKWQSSLDGTTWTDIANTASTYTSGALAATTQFRAVVKSGSCAAANSTATTVIVDPTTVAGAVSGGTIICSGATSGALTLAGYTGSIVKWQASLNGTTWTDIVNTASTYTSGALTATTQFRAIVKSGTCAVANSTATTVTVDPNTVAGAVSGGTTVCSGATSGTLTLAGYTGSIVKWQSSLDGTTWTDIFNTASTYTSGALTATTQFRAVVKSGACAAANSAATTVTLNPATVAGAVSGGTTICEGSNSALLTLTGHTGAVIKWQSSIDGISWTDITNTTISYTSSVLSQTTQFRAVVQSGGCSALNSSPTTVTVNSTTVAGNVSGGTTICLGASSPTLNLTGNTGAVLRWQATIDGTTWNDIANTATSYISGPLSQTTQFRAVVQGGACSEANSTATTVTVDPATVAGSVSGGTTICSGSTSGTLTLAGYVGSIVKWQSSLDGTTWSDIANTTASYTSDALAATTQFRAVVKSGDCAVANSAATAVTVDPATFAGAVSGGTTVCSAATSATLTLAGYTGSIVKWQSSLDGTIWTDIVNSAATYTSGALSATTQFRAVVKSGACTAANSTATTVTVDPATVGGAVSGGATVCSGAVSGTLTLAGHTGSIIKWQSSLDGTTWTDIVNTAATYTSGALTATTQFRAVVKSGACAAANSTATTVTVDPATVAGTVSGGVTVCSGSTSGILTLAGYTGSIVKWQSSLDGTSWTDIANTTASYTSGALTVTTQFRAVVKSGACTAANSTATTVIVDPATVGGAVSGGATVCSGAVSGTLTLAGYAGSIVKWQSSLDGATWTDIANTAATYTSGALTATTQFRAVVKSGACAAANSASTTLTVDPATIAGSVSGGTTICEGSNSALLTLAGHTGTVIKWQSSTDGISWTDIANTTVSYTSSVLSQTTQFRAVIQSGACSPLNSSHTTVTVNPTTVAGNVSGGTTICLGASSPTLNLTGNTGAVLKWQASIDGTTWNDIANTTASYTSGPLSQTTQFRAVVQGGACSEANSTATTVTVDPATVAGSVSGGTAICSGSASGTLTLAGYTGSIVKWQSSLDGTTWTDIANTTSTYTSGALSASTQFRAVVKSGACATANSTATTVTIDPAVIAGSVSGGSTVCSGSNSVTLTLAGYTGSIVKWQSSLDGTTWTDIVNTAATYTSGVLTITTQFRAVVKSGTCSEVNSSATTVTVDPAITISITNPASVCSPATVDITTASVTTGSTTNLIYSYWLDAAANNALASPATLSASGIYYIKGANSNGCFDIKPVVVTVNPSPIVIVTDPASVCSAATVDITAASVTAGSTPSLIYSYWSDASATAALNSPNAVATSGTYYIKGTNSDGCFDIKSVNVTILSSQTLDAGPDEQICQQSQPLTLSGFSIAGGTWSGSGIKNNNFDPSIASLGDNVLTYTVTSGSCIVSDTKTIKVLPEPTATISTAGSTAICEGGGVTLTSGSGLGYTYQWTKDGINIPGATAIDYTASSEGNYTVSITSNGCSKTSSPIAISISPMPTFDLGEDKHLCSGSTLIIGKEIPNVTYLWNNGATTPTINVTATGKYWCTITNAGNCSINDSINISFQQKPAFNLDGFASSYICKGDTISISSSLENSEMIYEWSSTGQGSFEDKNTSTTKYFAHPTDDKIILSLTITNSCGSASESKNISFNESVDSKFTYTTERLPGLIRGMKVKDKEEIKFTPDYLEADSYLWNFGDGNTSLSAKPTHNFPEEGKYVVTLIMKKNTCYASYSDTIYVEKNQILYVPNAFYPAANNPENRQLKVYGDNISARDFVFKVFDRWGEEIYSTKDFNEININGWNGTNKSGKLAPPSTYTYILKGQFNTGEKINNKGTITIIY